MASPYSKTTLPAPRGTPARCGRAVWERRSGDAPGIPRGQELRDVPRSTLGDRLLLLVEHDLLVHGSRDRRQHADRDWKVRGEGSARSFAAFTLLSSWTQSALAGTSLAVTTFGRTPSMMTARRSSCGPKRSGLPCSSRSSYWSFCSLSYITFHARSLYTLQFWRISTNAAPRWRAARFSISSMCGMFRSTVRPTKVAPQPSANARGFTGRSAEPTGVDFVTLPSSLVGEY